MLEPDAIVDSLLRAGLTPASEPIRDPSDRAHYFIFVNVERDSTGRQSPSRQVLEAAIQLLKAQGISLDILLLDPVSQDIEAGARATALFAFPDLTRNLFLSVRQRDVVVWIDAKRTLDEDQRRTISDRLAIYLSSFNLRLASLTTLGEGNVAGKLALLRQIRASAPVSPEDLLTKLTNSGFTVPSAEWLARRLDALRKASDIVRLGDGTYAPSAATIRALGTTHQGRSSPDVSRLLALARDKR